MAKKPAAPYTLPQIPATDITPLLNALNTGVDYGALTRQGTQQAQAVTQSAVDAYNALGRIYQQQAAQRAQSINQAGVGAANYERQLNLPGQVASDIRRAAADRAALAQGFSGGLRDVAAAEAAKINRNLASLGAPQTVPDGAAAANALYGISGQIPASVLQTAAPLMAAQYREIPAQSLAYAQAQAQGALGAGAKQVERLLPSITQALAKQPALAQQYTTSLVTAAEKARQASVQTGLALLRIKQSEDAAKALADYRARPQVRSDGKGGLVSVAADGTITQVSTGPADLHPDGKGGTIAVNPYNGKVTQVTYGSADVRSDGSGGLVSVDPYTGEITQVKDGPVKWQQVHDANGTYLIDPETFRKVKVAGPSGSAASANKPKLVTAPDGSKVIVRTNPDGSLTFQNAPGKLGKARPKPASTSTSAFRGATKVAQISFAGSKGDLQPIAYEAAYKRVYAYLRGAGVPAARAKEQAQSALVSVGYEVPVKGTTNFFGDPLGAFGLGIPPPRTGSTVLGNLFG